ncbi:MAG: signal peptidase I [Mogibacterium sp.]|nr:signal peptidase I [Mogibacterium sp.]MBR0127677.1 signal peptidase I [Bacillota bacterium]
MIRIVDIAGAIDMSRVERNTSIYEENKTKPSGGGMKTTGRIMHGAGIILMSIVVAACLTLAIPKLVGYDGYVVVSGSMEPNIPVGSIVYSEKTDPALLRTGDVIVFVDELRGTTPITHRVVSNNPFTGTIITKGDANENQDVNPVTYDSVIGKVVNHVPRIGFTAAMFTSKLGKLIAALILLEAWLLMEVGRRLKGTDRGSEKQIES